MRCNEIMSFQSELVGLDNISYNVIESCSCTKTGVPCAIFRIIFVSHFPEKKTGDGNFIQRVQLSPNYRKLPTVHHPVLLTNADI